MSRQEKEFFPPVPEAFLRHFDEANSACKEGAVVGLDFSRRTYQSRTYDKKAKEEYWSLLHLDEEGLLSESFCLCSETKGDEGCSHVLAAFLALYQGGLLPLHIRYEESFIRAFFLHLFSKKESPLPRLLKEIAFQTVTESGKKFIDELKEKISAEREEESLQHSDLTEEELLAIEEKKMPLALRFHFSPHNELAKALYVASVLKKTGLFRFQKKEKGGEIAYENGDLSFHFLLDDSSFTKLLTLFSESSHGFTKALFDAKRSELLLEKGGHELKIPKGEIGAFLNRNCQELHLIGAFSMGSKKPIFLQKCGYFSPDNSLHLEPYLEEFGDLKEAKFFGRWLFIDNRFLFISGPLFLQQEIPPEEVEGFVLANQAELESVAGFRFHKTAKTQAAEYFVDIDGNLHLERRSKEGGQGVRLFGRILYLPEEGFYPIADLEEWPVGVIPKRKVGSYLRSHLSAIEMIPGFIIERSPFRGFHLTLKSSEKKIEMAPKVVLDPEFHNTPLRVYDGWIYLEGKGFFPVSPLDMPFDLAEMRTVEASDWGSFFDKEWEKIASFCSEIPRALLLLEEPSLKLVRLSWSDEEKQWSVDLTLGGIPLELLWEHKAPFFLGEFGRLDLREGLFVALKKALARPNHLSSLELLRLLFSFDLQMEPDCEPIVAPLLAFRAPNPPDLSSLRSQLRDYQKKAVDWLWFLYSHRLSALLADDMGLGKTHEAMGLIAALFKNPQEKGIPSCLIVCPTSLLFHWEEKLATYLPTLRVHLFWGKDRQLEEADIVLTSYTVFRRDFALFQNKGYSLAIFDEVQLAKNHQSRLSHVLKEVKARMKLGLSGTPIENRLREIKALFDLLLPGLMPGEKEFYDEYILPIERGGDRRAEKSLQKKISPFILRRTKEEVLTELPEKIEEVEKAFLEESQEILYKEVLEKGKQGILQPLLTGEKPPSLIPIFALITQLKKICNHPALYYKDIENYKEYPCGKWELFKELVEEALESGQKVVVFSHFLQMLDIIEDYLQEEKVPFSRLRGETKNRKEEVERFQKDPNCRIFVASLQAGGLGIDLTAGSVVIHYDRWWNFAKENQATDRVHRLGQTRGVQVFKLMTKNTIEEHIDKLIQKKADLHEKMVSKDEADLLKSFTSDDLKALFGLI